MEAAGRGEHATAIDLLAKASRRSGGDPQVDANLGQALLLAGRGRDALGPLRRARSRAGDVPAILRLLAGAAQDAGDAREAEAAYRRLIGSGATIDPGTLNNFAVLLQGQGRLIEAAELLEQAVEFGAGPEGLNNLANLRARLGMFEAATALFGRATLAAPLRADLWRNAAIVHRDHGAPDLASASARRAVVIAPSDAASLDLLAELLERRSDLEVAERLVRRATILDPDDVDAHRLLTRIGRRRGDAAAVAAAVLPVLRRVVGRPNAYRLWFERALALDVAGDHAAAFEAFRVANETQRQSLPAGRVDPRRPFQQIDGLLAVLSELARTALAPSAKIKASHEAECWTKPEDDPVFLVGFPRSGTTLLDQVLDSHPKVTVLEERPLVTGMIGRLAARGIDYPSGLPGLDAAAVADLRAGYFEDRDRLVTLAGDVVFVDKMPLNIVHAGLIRRIFPEARFLLALRHPVDVCLSCFMQAFELNDWMAVFSSLEETARLYRAVFSLWRETRSALDLAVHEVRYEDLTADLEVTAGAAVRFLGLDWDSRMAAFHEHARARKTLATPSFSQVTRPIYRDAVARWRRYGFATNAIATMLDQEIEAFGYGDRDG